MANTLAKWDQELLFRDVPCPTPEDMTKFISLFSPAKREDGRVYNGYILLQQKRIVDTEENGLVPRMDWIWGYAQDKIGDIFGSDKLHATDTYITFNAMRRPFRRQMDDAFALSNIVIDIDWHGMEPEDAQILARALASQIRDGMVTAVIPNMMVHTGRGVQVWYSITQLPAIAKWRYDLVRDELIDIYRQFLENDPIYEGFGVDNLKANGLVRLPWSYNSKAGSYAIPEFIHCEKHNWWDEQWWSAYNLDKETKNAKIVKIDRAISNRPKQKINAGAVAYVKKRLGILKKLRDLRSGRCCEDRDLFLYMVYCSVIKAVGEHDVAMQYVFDFNEGFQNPLDIGTIKKFLSTAKVKKYPVSNAWIIDNMGVSDEECRMIGLERKDKKGDKERANENRAERERIKSEIIKMAENGVSRKEISGRLGCSLKHISVTLKEYRERCVKEDVTEFANKMSLDSGCCALDQQMGDPIPLVPSITEFANKMSLTSGCCPLDSLGGEGTTLVASVAALFPTGEASSG